MTVNIDPPRAPAHQCMNVNCGCNDLVSAGPCSEWCSANGSEVRDVARGDNDATPCECGDATCQTNRSAAGTAERGMS